MKIDFEYGQGTMTAELPDNTDIFIPGETVPDPDYIPEDKLEEAYLDSLAQGNYCYHYRAGPRKRRRAAYQPQKDEHQIYSAGAL